MAHVAVDHDLLLPIFKEMSEHALLQYHVHLGWKHQMILQWLTVTTDWIKALEKKDSDNKPFAFLSAENWKWGIVDLLPKNRAP